MTERLDTYWFRKKEEEEQRQRAQRNPTSPASPTPMPEGRASKYAQRAYANELEVLHATPNGERNDQLNKSAFNLGQLVGAGALDEEVTRSALRDAALTVGLEPGETERSIASGLTAGIKQPRVLSVAPEPQPQAAQPPVPVVEQVAVPTDNERTDFWEARPLLRHLHNAARARRASPWAVLGVALARIATATPVNVVLPPIIGGQASLNTFVGLVGPSGSGKGAAERVAADLLVLGKSIKTVTTGSGEGIGHAYKTRKQGELVWNDDDHAVLFSVPEIDTLSALGSRKGATLLPELRRGWSGEALGFAYADPSRRLEIELQQYRMCLVAGIQPTRAQALLDDSDGGTPQRFLWMPATDPHAPDHRPECPAPLHWRAPAFNRSDLRDAFSHGRMEVPVCEVARATIDAAQLTRIRGTGDALDGHLLLCQLKTAAVLAIADGRLEVADEDWQLADVVVRWSTSCRAGVAYALENARKAKNMGQADAEAERTLHVQDRQVQAQQQRVARRIVRHLSGGEVLSHAVLRKRIAARDRIAFDEAVELLLQAGQIVREETEHGVHYHQP